MATKIQTVSVSAEYLKKILKEGGNAWATVWANGKPVKGASVLGIRFNPKNEAGYYNIDIIANTGKPRKASSKKEVDEELL